MKLHGRRISLLTDFAVPVIVFAISALAVLLGYSYLSTTSVSAMLSEFAAIDYSRLEIAGSLLLALAFLGVLEWKIMFWRVRAERLTGGLLLIISAPLLFLGAPFALVSGLLGAALVYHGMYSRRATELGYQWSLRN